MINQKINKFALQKINNSIAEVILTADRKEKLLRALKSVDRQTVGTHFEKVGLYIGRVSIKT